VSFTALDADENGQNGGAVYAEVRTPPSGGSSGSGSGRVWIRVPDTGSGPPPNPPGRTGCWKREITLKNVTWVWRDDGPIPPPKHPLDPSSPVKPATDDIRRVIEMCQGDPAAERAIGTLFIQIANTPKQGFYNTRNNKCFRWLKDFLKNYKYEGKPIELEGGAVVIEALVVPTKGNKELPTSYSAFGVTTGTMTDHAIVRVTIQPNGKQKFTAYFDLGSSTHLGNYGGADHWFFDDTVGFLVEMDMDGARPFDPSGY
ncbi:MAG: hypothetical protein NUV77_26780, partial [Thermoguttaceae bacterium]|nr:hypothetical protein [Thermoguttaceae bacterium]